MKKVDEEYLKKFPVIHPSIDDLKSIFNILNEHGRRVEILSKGYKYDTLDELIKDYYKPISILTLNAFGRELKSPYFSLSFGSGFICRSAYSAVTLYVSNKELGSGEIFRIQEILNKKRPFINIIIPRWGCFLFLAIAYITLLFYPAHKQPYFILLPLIIFITMLPFQRSLVFMKSSSINFFVRNRDAIFLLAIGAILGGVVTYVLSKFLGVR